MSPAAEKPKSSTEQPIRSQPSLKFNKVTNSPFLQSESQTKPAADSKPSAADSKPTAADNKLSAAEPVRRKLSPSQSSPVASVASTTVQIHSEPAARDTRTPAGQGQQQASANLLPVRSTSSQSDRAAEPSNRKEAARALISSHIQSVQAKV